MAMQQNPNIDHGKDFDWGRASADYARYRDIYPPEFYDKLLELGLCRQGQEVLDLGTGTGVLPRALYSHGARFTGVDISPEQIAQAKRLSGEQGMDIAYLACSAEELGFAPESFDVILASQCFFYFDEAVVAPKIHRMLRAGGRFCELFMAWLPQESEIAQKSEELVLRHNPHWTGNGYCRSPGAFPQWAKGLFDEKYCGGYDLCVPFTRRSWHGRMMACRGTGASGMDPAAIEAFEREHLAWLETQPEEFTIPHYVSVVCLEKSGGE